MLEAAVRACPDDAWDSAAHVNRFWHIAYHTLFYVNLYLFQTVDDHKPWRGHRDDAQNLRPGVEPYSRDSILEFLAFCREHARRRIAALDLGAESGFSWLSVQPRGAAGLQFAPSPAPHWPAQRAYPPGHRRRRRLGRPRLTPSSPLPLGTREPCYTDHDMNLTITVDSDLLKRARIRALQEDTSVDAVLRRFLEAYAGMGERRRDPVADLLARSDAATFRDVGRSDGHATSCMSDDLRFVDD